MDDLLKSRLNVVQFERVRQMPETEMKRNKKSAVEHEMAKVLHDYFNMSLETAYYAIHNLPYMSIEFGRERAKFAWERDAIDKFENLLLGINLNATRRKP